MSSGQLILLSDDATENVVYEPVNNCLNVGSENSANVCLSGLKNLAFGISIDNFGRVQITLHMKRIQLNGKRCAKNATRPLVNNSSIVAGNYKFIWKYDSKFTKSYSLSPGKNITQNTLEIELLKLRNRKTINCLAVKTENDENASAVSAVETIEEEVNKQKLEPPTPTETKSIDNGNTASNRRSILIPVKSNRTSELRRASIARSKSVSNLSSASFHYRTPNKPIIGSASLVKSVNAIIRSESHTAPITQQRKSLGTKVNLPKFIDGLNLFNDVTDAMKSSGGPYKYIFNKFGASNSPKRTPKSALLKPKRLSLRSELSEMGILKCNVTGTSVASQDEQQTTASTSAFEQDVNNVIESQAKNATDISSTEDTVPTVTEILTPDTPEQRTNESVVATLINSSPVELLEDSMDSFNGTDDETSDSEFSIISVEDDSQIVVYDTSPEIVQSTLTQMKSEDIVIDESIAMEHQVIERSAEQQSIALTEDSTQNSQESIENDSSKTSTIAASESVATPNKLLPIRARRNSRLCSLDECCSPSGLATPSKSKLTANIVSTPRSILKTPKASKTPKKSVRILETIFHEEEDDAPTTNGEQASVSIQQNDLVSMEQQIVRIDENESLDVTSNENEIFIDALSSDVTNSVDEIVIARAEVDSELCNESIPNSNGTETMETLNGTFDIASESEGKLVPSQSEESSSVNMPLSTGVTISIDVSQVTTITSTPTTTALIDHPSLDEPLSSIGSLTSLDDKRNLIDQTITESVHGNISLDEVFIENKGDEMSTFANESKETNMFDETYEIEDNDKEMHSTMAVDESIQLGDTTMKGVKELLNTPKPVDKTNLVGMKELLRTPADGNKTLCDMRGVKELLNTPNPLNKTNLVGMKELLQTPADGSNSLSDMRGVKELLNTPRPLDQTNLVGMKELLKTPADDERTYGDMRGVKELLNTPKLLDNTNLLGLRELLNTPNAMDQTVDMRGMRELLNTPNILDRTNLIGIKELLKTPARLNEDDLDGLFELLQTPATQSQSPDTSTSSPSMAIASSPSSTATASSSSADDQKKFRLSLKFNSRRSLLDLVNSKLKVMGMSTIPDENEQEPVLQAPPAPIPEEEHHDGSSSNAAELNDSVANDFQPLEHVNDQQQSSNDVEVSTSEPAEASTSSNDQNVTIPEDKNGEVDPIAAESKGVNEIPNDNNETAMDAHSEVEVDLATDSSESQAESQISVAQNESAMATDDPSSTKTKRGRRAKDNSLKVETKVSKTPRKTRTRKASVVEPPESHDELSSGNDEATEPIKSNDPKVNELKAPKVEPKAAKTPRKTRTRKASVVEPPESHDELSSGNDEATEPIKFNDPKVNELKAPKVEPKAAKTPRKTRTRKASVVEPPESHDELSSGNDEATEPIKFNDPKVNELKAPKVEPKAAKTPTKTRTRKASVVEPSESHDERSSGNDEATEPVKFNDPKVNELKAPKVEPKATKTPRKTRTRNASVLEPQAFHEDLTSGLSGNDEATEASESVAKKTSTRKRQASTMEPTDSYDENLSENDDEDKEKPKVDVKSTKTRQRKQNISVKSNATDTSSTSVASKAVPKTRKRKASELEAPQNEVFQNVEAIRSDPTKVSKTPKKTRGRKATTSAVEQPESSGNNEATVAELEPSKDELKSSKTPRKVRTLKANAVNPPDSSHDENLSETDDEATEEPKVDVKSTKTRQRKQNISVKSNATDTSSTSVASKTVPKTRKRKASNLEMSQNDVVQNVEPNASVTEPTKVEPKAKKIRGRQAPAIEPLKSDESIANISAGTTKTVKTRGRNASVLVEAVTTEATKLKSKAPATRKRRASETSNVSESSQATNSDANATRTRKRTKTATTDEPPAIFTRNTRNTIKLDSASNVPNKRSKRGK